MVNSFFGMHIVTHAQTRNVAAYTQAVYCVQVLKMGIFYLTPYTCHQVNGHRLLRSVSVSLRHEVYVYVS